MSDRTNIKCLDPFKEDGQWWSGVRWDEGARSKQRLIDRGRSTHHEAKRDAEQLARKVEAEGKQGDYPPLSTSTARKMADGSDAMVAERELTALKGRLADMTTDNTRLLGKVRTAEAERNAALSDVARLEEELDTARGELKAIAKVCFDTGFAQNRTAVGAVEALAASRDRLRKALHADGAQRLAVVRAIDDLVVFADYQGHPAYECEESKTPAGRILASIEVLRDERNCNARLEDLYGQAKEAVARLLAQVAGDDHPHGRNLVDDLEYIARECAASSASRQTADGLLKVVAHLTGGLVAADDDIEGLTQEVFAARAIKDAKRWRREAAIYKKSAQKSHRRAQHAEGILRAVGRKAAALDDPPAPEGDRCPSCGAAEVEAETPRTVYACGSSDYDGRKVTFRQGKGCPAGKLAEEGSP